LAFLARLGTWPASPMGSDDATAPF
jgi:hypothetical protein